MKQSDMFGAAAWVTHGEATPRRAYILRTVCSLTGVRQATLHALGLGVQHVYVNGVRVGDDWFLPLASDYEARPHFPPEEQLTGHRAYVPVYDLTPYLRDGDNVLSIHFGGGWYTYDRAYGDFEKRFGDPKVIYRLFGEDARGAFEFVSGTDDRITESFVCDYHMTWQEVQDYRALSEAALTAEADATLWPQAVPARPLDTDYLFSDCPADAVDEHLPVRLIGAFGGARVYDAGKNTSGRPVLRIRAAHGERVTVRFSEERTPEGALHPDFEHMQTFTVIGDGAERTVRPLFTWFAFRYLSVEGAAELLEVESVYARTPVTADFSSDSELLNWIFTTFLNTQRTNMHTGIPSDCPHLERRGYTGDGQLICHTAMSVLDAYAFYRKWIDDISDCQDVLSGHVQYTAPYTHSGGGPGGWGSAIVEVPYQLWRHYGDGEPMRRLYPQMLRYFDYLESHSEHGLVVRDKEGEWCLGDWCPPESVALPAPFVNNYFYIKALGRVIEIARATGHEADIPLLEERLRVRRAAILRCYYNNWDGNFLGGVQGANAFALAAGLGDERTFRELVRRYESLGCYDTGIFGTELLTRTLFEGGEGELAVRLLLSEHEHSFAEMRRRGATTLWEYWPGSLKDRSHNHPMFGAVVGLLLDHLLGIGQTATSVGYRELELRPFLPRALGRIEGHRTLPLGVVRVSLVREGEGIRLSVTLPADTSATLIWGDARYTLGGGESCFCLPDCQPKGE